MRARTVVWGGYEGSEGTFKPRLGMRGTSEELILGKKEGARGVDMDRCGGSNGAGL